MSSAGVFEKKSKCQKENFQSAKRGKCLSIEFRDFGKSERKFRRENFG